MASASPSTGATIDLQLPPGDRCSLATKRQVIDDIRVIRLSQEFAACGYRCLRQITVAIESNVIVLRGSVGSYHMKQTAQEIVRRAFPDQLQRNLICVMSMKRADHPKSRLVPGKENASIKLVRVPR